jgi:hypothetical protein
MNLLFSVKYRIQLKFYMRNDLLFANLSVFFIFFWSYNLRENIKILKRTASTLTRKSKVDVTVNWL